MRRWLGFLMALILLPSAMAHGDEDGHETPEFEERVLEGALGPMDLHGTRLAWARDRDGQVDLVVTDLKDGAEVVVTRIPVGGEHPVQSIAFDGRWVAWTDARFGNLDAFAVDVREGQLVRLSEHPDDDKDIDVAEGRFAWIRDAVVLADETGAAQVVSGSEGSWEVAFAGSWLVWSQPTGERHVLLGQYLGDNTVHTLADDEDFSHGDLDGADDGNIVWVGAKGTLTRVHSLLLRADGSVGGAKVLTNWGVYVEPRTGGGHAAWMVSGVVWVERISDGRSSTVDQFRPPLLSSDLLAITRWSYSDAYIDPTPWGAWDAQAHADQSRDPRPYLVGAGVALLVGSAGVHWFRSRRHESN